MSHTTREPCTKFLGPNARIFPVVTDVTVDFQLHNLDPGEFWIPGSELAIHTLRHIPRMLGTNFFHINADGFLFNVLWSKTLARIQCRSLVNMQWVFRLFLFYGVTRWGTNDRTTFAGNFAYNGTVTLSWLQG